MTPVPASAVVDSFALYRIVTGHGPDAVAVRDAALTGRLRLLAPSVAVAVTAGMRDCWDETCVQRHGFLGRKLTAFCQLSSLESTLDNAAAAVDAGRLYAASTTMRIDGPEVLAACHAARLAARNGCELLTAARASYCYRAAQEAGLQVFLRTV
ncbi:hypothetical protein ACFV98_29950 [Streptomyces violascens]|uniref:hypothetical protein n=1 Tax=Streptomyces violascens TaxID=67381 RepID=UPI00366437C7